MLFWILTNQVLYVIPSPSISHSYHHYECLLHIFLDFQCSICYFLVVFHFFFFPTTSTCNSYHRFLLSGACFFFFFFSLCILNSVIYSLTSVFFLFHINILSVPLTFSLPSVPPFISSTRLMALAKTSQRMRMKVRIGRWPSQICSVLPMSECWWWSRWWGFVFPRDSWFLSKAWSHWFRAATQFQKWCNHWNS